MTVISPKTEGCGQGSRVVPMFERLRPYLDEAWEMADECQTRVIPEHLYLAASQGPNGWRNCNLRTTFKKIVLRAGMEPWPPPVSQSAGKLRIGPSPRVPHSHGLQVDWQHGCYSREALHSGIRPRLSTGSQSRQKHVAQRGAKCGAVSTRKR